MLARLLFLYIVRGGLGRGSIINLNIFFFRRRCGSQKFKTKPEGAKSKPAAPTMGTREQQQNEGCFYRQIPCESISLIDLCTAVRIGLYHISISNTSYLLSSIYPKLYRYQWVSKFAASESASGKQRHAPNAIKNPR